MIRGAHTGSESLQVVYNQPWLRFRPPTAITSDKGHGDRVGGLLLWDAFIYLWL